MTQNCMIYYSIKATGKQALDILNKNVRIRVWHWNLEAFGYNSEQIISSRIQLKWKSWNPDFTTYSLLEYHVISCYQMLFLV